MRSTYIKKHMQGPSSNIRTLQKDVVAKRRGGKKRSAEQIARKVAWAAVKKEYEKLGKERRRLRINFDQVI
jgi:hypothetical protein